MTYQIILASSSMYRRTLLERVCKDFQCVSPNIDESRLENETVETMVKRLACEKSLAVSTLVDTFADTTPKLIIGSDQAAEFENKVVGKPKSHENAVEHLLSVAGKQITLHTGIALYNTQTKQMQSSVVPFIVKYRKYNRKMVERYLSLDKPYDCAGSLKAESHGILLIEKMQGDDPNALIGLPLIELTTMFANENYSLL